MPRPNQPNGTFPTVVVATVPGPKREELAAVEETVSKVSRDCCGYSIYRDPAYMCTVRLRTGLL